MKSALLVCVECTQIIRDYLYVPRLKTQCCEFTTSIWFIFIRVNNILHQGLQTSEKLSSEVSGAGVVAGVRRQRCATVGRGSNPTLQAHLILQKGVAASLLPQPLFAKSHDAAFNFLSQQLGLRTVAPIVRVAHGCPDSQGCTRLGGVGKRHKKRVIFFRRCCEFTTLGFQTLDIQATPFHTTVIRYVLMYGVWAGFFTPVQMYGQWPDLRGAWGRPAKL